MKRVNKLAAAIALALSAGVVSQAKAVMVLDDSGKGDALLFPAYQGYMENYFTIMNTSDDWIQGHIRFRGAGWTAEMLDFDVILSPYDVFVFRLADLDGDGYWEIDQKLDPDNFAYTGYLYNNSDATRPQQCVGAVTKDNCIDQRPALIPTPTSIITEAEIEYNRNQGYVEFIAEGVFLTTQTPAAMKNTMMQLSSPANAGQLAQFGQRRAGNRVGTHLWSWTDADGARGGAPYAADFGAADVGNVLTGTAFITAPGSAVGVVYNAEAISDFRTNDNPHRIDNYPERGVIIHHENSISPANGISPAGDYVYGWPWVGDGFLNPATHQNPDNRQDEARISFNNTWGPTMADGDDYNLDGSGAYAPTRTRWTQELTLQPGTTAAVDDWDITLNNANDSVNFITGLPTNSIAEVEEMIRQASMGTQNASSFYFDSMGRINPADMTFSGGVEAIFDAACQGNGREDGAACSNTNLTSYFYTYFPTKFYYGESSTYHGTSSTLDAYIVAAVTEMLSRPKEVIPGIWDIKENAPVPPPTGDCVFSPCRDTIVEQYRVWLKHEVNYYPIGVLKYTYDQGSLSQFDFGKGLVVIGPNPTQNNPVNTGSNPKVSQIFPWLNYTFEVTSDGQVTGWRPMHR